MDTQKRTFKLAILIAVTSWTSVSLATEFKIDPAHSAVIFKIRHSDVNYIWGRFNKVSGRIITDQSRDPKEFDFQIEVAVRSIDTNNKKRNKHLKSSEFFKATKHKIISFKTNKVKKLENGQLELYGTLNMLNVKKDIVVLFNISPTKVEGLVFRLGGDATFTVKRSDFGLGSNAKGIADEVTIMVSLEAKYKMIPMG